MLGSAAATTTLIHPPSPEERYARLHLGCGRKHLPGWFHIDLLDYPHIDHWGPVEDLSYIPDSTSEIIYACHVLEHFGRKDSVSVLSEWRRVLKPGGILRVAVPDFAACAKLYLSGGLQRGLEDIRGLMIGGQRDKYDYHGNVFDEADLTRMMKEAGFSVVRRWDWRTTDHAHLDDYSQGYLPHMDKENGTLISLNLEGVV